VAGWQKPGDRLPPYQVLTQEALAAHPAGLCAWLELPARWPRAIPGRSERWCDGDIERAGQ
jgi:hypothetical protein